ncbi:MAG: hypothetical protein Q4D51_08780 [Eubacteriales bacterium]|nr:hypothetical protein [Eubacteriales bacterium]
MLLRTYQKMVDVFKKHNGYMSFAMLKEVGISVLQIREMEREQLVHRFARGWYWCNECGIKRPENHKYIEIAMANPNAIICMQSAAYLHGIVQEEPKQIQVATARTDRKKMEFDDPIKRFYLQNAVIDGEIEVIHTEFGDYKVYSIERTICDCLRMKEHLEESVYWEVVDYYKNREEQLVRVKQYAKALRALKNVMVDR